MNTEEIFITVNEYLANGGPLTKGTILYCDEKSGRRYEKGKYLGYDHVQHTHLLSNMMYDSFPFYNAVTFVKVPITIQYKAI